MGTTRQTFSISVHAEALRQYPNLDKLQRQFFPMSSLNDVMNVLEKREEKLKLELVYNVLKVSLRIVDREANQDHLGLPRIEGLLKDLCDIIRESTSFNTRSGIDPRREIYYSRKSSILQGSNLSDDALIAPNCLSPRGIRKHHPLDLVSTEEVVQRRQLADRRWQEQKKQFKRSNRKIEQAKDWFAKKPEGD
jgi:hypothetical protein